MFPVKLLFLRIIAVPVSFNTNHVFLYLLCVHGVSPRMSYVEALQICVIHDIQF
jgi:hypothetical protein